MINVNIILEGKKKERIKKEKNMLIDMQQNANHGYLY